MSHTMQALSDEEVDQALEDCGLELLPQDFGNNQLTEILKSYFIVATAEEIRFCEALVALR